MAAGAGLPTRGTAFLSVANRDKRHVVFPAKRLSDLGFKLVATKGTARVLSRAGVPVWVVRKRSEGHPDVIDLIEGGKVDLVVNTPFGRRAHSDGFHIRRAAADARVPCVTTIQGLLAAVRAIEALRGPEGRPRSLQELHASMATPAPQPELPLHEPDAAPALSTAERTR
jgi:carbamoyl-phosphate synthase large subunit